jgi:hypothetical protein
VRCAGPPGVAVDEVDFCREDAQTECLVSSMPLLQCLYGKHAAALYAQAADFNKTSRFYYMKAEDAYYLANAQASFDDWRRSRKQVILL